MKTKSWQVVIGLKGDVMLPQELVDYAGEYVAFSVNVVFENVRRRATREPAARICIDLVPHFVETGERAGVRTRRRVYIGRALAIAGIPMQGLETLSRQARTVKLAVDNSMPGPPVYRLDVSALTALYRAKQHARARLGMLPETKKSESRLSWLRRWLFGWKLEDIRRADRWGG